MGYFTLTQSDRVEDLKDKKGRKYREYNGKRITEIGTDTALIRTKKDGNLSKAASVRFDLLSLDITIIPINPTAFRVIIGKVTDEKIEP